VRRRKRQGLAHSKTLRASDRSPDFHGLWRRVRITSISAEKML
jgi:hypothetical protein